MDVSDRYLDEYPEERDVIRAVVEALLLGGAAAEWPRPQTVVSTAWLYDAEFHAWVEMTARQLAAEVEARAWLADERMAAHAAAVRELEWRHDRVG